jgi:hypothetical protein
MICTPSANRVGGKIEYREEKENKMGELILITNSNSFQFLIKIIITPANND